MSSVITTPIVRSSSNLGVSHSSEHLRRSPRETPLVWGERSAARAQYIARPGQRARRGERRVNSSFCRRSQADRSRPGRGAVEYGRPALSVSTAQHAVRRELPAGGNLTRLMAVWALGIGTFFGIFGSFIFDQGQEEAVNSTITPAYASYSAQ